MSPFTALAPSLEEEVDPHAVHAAGKR